jgi:hypothetical protein
VAGRAAKKGSFVFVTIMSVTLEVKVRCPVSGSAMRQFQKVDGETILALHIFPTSTYIREFRLNLNPNSRTSLELDIFNVERFTRPQVELRDTDMH